MNPLNWNDWECYLLALCLWREARGEPTEAKIGVVYTVLNRVKARSWFGDSISEVLVKPWQYSAMTAKNDPQLVKFPTRGCPSFAECMEIVGKVINLEEPDPTDGATHYHDISIGTPKWASPEGFKVQLGRVRFYKVD